MNGKTLAIRIGGGYWSFVPGKSLYLKRVADFTGKHHHLMVQISLASTAEGIARRNSVTVSDFNFNG